jgi:hypothetical protein
MERAEADSDINDLDVSVHETMRMKPFQTDKKLLKGI